MGYYADGGGFITAIDEASYNEVVRILDEYQRFSYWEDKLDLTVYPSSDDRYYEDRVIECLDKTAPFVKKGEIEFVGEDHAMWRFYYSAKTGEWIEQNGHVTYAENDVAELICQIIDGFEDFLDRRGIVIKNDEKDSDAEDGCDGVANIYGSDYDELQTYIEDTLRQRGLI